MGSELLVSTRAIAAEEPSFQRSGSQLAYKFPTPPKVSSYAKLSHAPVHRS